MEPGATQSNPGFPWRIARLPVSVAYDSTRAQHQLLHEARLHGTVVLKWSRALVFVELADALHTLQRARALQRRQVLVIELEPGQAVARIFPGGDGRLGRTLAGDLAPERGV